MAGGVGRTKFLREFPEALHEGTAAVFLGAGVSMAAGYPSWAKLLEDIGKEIGVKSSDIHDLAALAQWHIRETGGATGVRNVIRREIAPELALPETVRIIARLPLRHIWTTNYDRLAERAFAEINRPIEPISGEKDLALKARPGAARLYKMHGSVDHLDDIVISTDDYELYRRKRGAFLPLLQAHLTSMSVLFVGLSLTDPNVRHVLSLIRESFNEAPPEHFAILRAPKRGDYATEDEFQARAAQHALWAKDLSRYGLIPVEVEDYDEVPELLRQVERRVASLRVWVSGSWPLGAATDSISWTYALAEQTGRLIGESGRDLVSGSGVLVGSAAMAGFVDALRREGGWDIDRRLIVRPFPQPLPGGGSQADSWKALRRELARQAGIVVIVGGVKLVGQTETIADGVIEEAELAEAAGAFLLPVGASGGAAAQIAARLRGSKLEHSGPSAQRPTDAEIDALADQTASVEALVQRVQNILGRLAKEL